MVFKTHIQLIQPDGLCNRSEQIFTLFKAMKDIAFKWKNEFIFSFVALDPDSFSVGNLRSSFSRHALH